MTGSTDLLSLFIPLTAADREQAASLARLQVTVAGATRVYRNTLAVLATAQYLKMLEIDSDLTTSYSLNPAVQLVADIADLYIPEARKRIECRSVYPGEQSVSIPEEVWEDRLGFVIVKVDENGTRADLLGFVPEVTVENLSLSYLRPLEELIRAIEDVPIPVTPLRDWLQGKASAAWKTLTEISQPPAKTLAPAFRNRSSIRSNELVERMRRIYVEQHRSSLDSEGLRQRIQQLYSEQPAADAKNNVRPLMTQTSAEESSFSTSEAIAALERLAQNALDASTQIEAAELLWILEPDHSVAGALRILDLGLRFEEHALALIVAVLPRPDGRFLVLTRMYSLQQPKLPIGLTLSGLDDADNEFFAVQSRRQDNYIQYYFIGDAEDSFSLQISLGASTLAENFQI